MLHQHLADPMGCSVQSPKCRPFTLAGSKDFPYNYDIYIYIIIGHPQMYSIG